MYTYNLKLRFDSSLLARVILLEHPRLGAKINIVGFPNAMLCANGRRIPKGACINHQPTLFKKHDDNSYTISVVSPIEKEGTIGGNTTVDIDVLNKYKGKFYYPCKYTFQVEDPELFINNCHETNSTISVSFITNKINTHISNAVKETVSMYVKEFGIEEFDSYLTSINDEIKEKVTKELAQFGIRLNNVDLHLSILDEKVNKMANHKRLQNQAIKEEKSCLD